MNPPDPLREKMLQSNSVSDLDSRHSEELTQDECDSVKCSDIPLGSASIMSTAYCMTNNMLGAGLLTLPYAMYRGSIIGGIVLLTSICCMSGYSVLLLARCADMTGNFSYKAIAVEAFGPHTGVAIEGLVCVLTFCSCIAYTTLVGDFIPKAAGFFHSMVEPGSVEDRCILALEDRRLVICFCAACVNLPLCLLRDLRSLRFSSFLAVCCIVFAGGVVIFYKAAGDGPALTRVELPEAWRVDAGAFVAMSLMSVAFTMHYNALQFYRELAGRSVGRMARASGLAFAACLGLYVAVGVAGYLTFGELVGGAYACPGVDASFLDSYDCQKVFIGEGPLEPGRFVGLTVTLLALVVAVALLARDVDVILAYKGALLGSWVVFILPPAFYLSLIRSAAHRGRPYTHKPLFGGTWLPRAVMIYGGVYGVLGTITTTLLRLGYEI